MAGLVSGTVTRIHSYLTVFILQMGRGDSGREMSDFTGPSPIYIRHTIVYIYPRSVPCQSLRTWANNSGRPLRFLPHLYCNALQGIYYNIAYIFQHYGVVFFLDNVAVENK